MISDKEKEDVRREARGILEKFGKALEKVQVKESGKKKGSRGYRDEKEGSDEDIDFRDRLFKNAPARSDDFLVAEKADWK